MAVEKIRELVTVRPRPTVVRLEHLTEQDAAWISATYFLTEQVRGHVAAVRHVLRQSHGTGVFVVGHYGSGKSHFLSYLTQQLRAGMLLEGDAAPEVVTVSLLNFRATMTLEEIVTTAAGVDAHEPDRRIAWERLAQEQPAGVVLVLDELSEFLRSKASRQAFNEDARFLQFLGEWAAGSRLWIVAALQEQIEHVGALESSLYRKIKDRFPLRLLLTPEHIRDLLASSILQRQPGYEEAVAELARQVEHALPQANVDLAALQQLYPLHPATLELLEEVRDLFSQTRGIVDFTVTQLLGDSSRGVAPFLDRPWGELLTPDVIVDHFADLFEVQPEFLPVAQRFLPYYRKQQDQLFPTDAQKTLGWRLLKLLMLDAISPERGGITPADAAAWLLFRATSITPEKNLEIIKRLLSNLASEGRFVTEHQGRYRLDLKDDKAEQLQRRLRAELAEVADLTPEVVWESLVAVLGEEEFNPFQLPRERSHQRLVRWHSHERPYRVFFGNGEPDLSDDVGLCLRLPWGDPRPAPRMVTVIPATLDLDEQLVELAALLRLTERPAEKGLKDELSRRIKQHRPLVATKVRSAYLEAMVHDSQGKSQSALRLGPADTLKRWLDGFALWALRRRYPSFELFAPAYGKLPKQAYLSFVRVATESDLGDDDSDEFVKIIREAYLVPMALMKRKGWFYQANSKLDQHELVKLLMPLLEHAPPPKLVYEHLSGSVYGLVPDQIHLLLVFLVLQGEIDITKGTRHYREIYQTQPYPDRYDRISLGQGLSEEKLNALAELANVFNIRLPKLLTVAAQRRLIERLRSEGAKQCQQLHPVLIRLKQVDGSARLVSKLEWVVNAWAALDKGETALQGLEHFLYEAGSVQRFVRELEQVRQLPSQLSQVITELKRVHHLLSDEVVRQWPDPVVSTRIAAVGASPGLDDLQTVQRWLQDARAAYEAYCLDYRKQHDRYWEELAEHAVWSWQEPNVAGSRHLGLTAELAELRQCRSACTELRCTGFSDLEFRARCSCGFDGETANTSAHLARFNELKEKIEQELRLFFQQDRVRQRIHEYKEKKLEVNQGILDYLETKTAVPDVKEISLFDQHLAGLELVEEIPASELVALCGDTVWRPQELSSLLQQRLNQHAPGRRVRVVTEHDSQVPREIMLWCLEQALRFAVPLPGRLSERVPADLVERIQPAWVSTDALVRLEELGLGETVEDQLLRWLLQGVLEMTQDAPLPPLLLAVQETLAPTQPQTALELAELSSTLFRCDRRMRSLAPRRWQQRLDELSVTSLATAAPDLVDALAQRDTLQWLVLDGLGLPLLSATLEVLDQALPRWRQRGISFAQVGETTTTQSWMDLLTDAGVQHSFTKVDAVDRLLHERHEPFEQLLPVLTAELQLALTSVRSQLSPEQPLLLFADHGFCLAQDGKGIVHGNSTTLERVVPLIELEFE